MSAIKLFSGLSVLMASFSPTLTLAGEVIRLDGDRLPSQSTSSLKVACDKHSYTITADIDYISPPTVTLRRDDGLQLPTAELTKISNEIGEYRSVGFISARCQSPAGVIIAVLARSNPDATAPEMKSFNASWNEDTLWISAIRDFKLPE